ncbi:hypothetical protein V5799_013750 [Amblyomma americanum]|uniref:Ran gtpase-activating protein n=2 Tax=Amblyomma americanum TaxID=6943 RepID=A0AAQ4E502_AMBAM
MEVEREEIGELVEEPIAGDSGSGGDAPSEGANSYLGNRITHVREVLASSGIDMEAACTHEDGRICWLPSKLSPCNKFLFPLGLELVETEPGTLCLRTVCVEPRKFAHTGEMYGGAFVFAWLPRHHRCVQAICVCDTVLFERPAFALNSAIGSSVNLRHLSLQGGYSTRYNDNELSEALLHLTKLESFEFIKLDVTSDSLPEVISNLLLRNSKSLVKVRFKRNAFSEQNISSLFSALTQCSALAELSFSQDSLTESHVTILAALLGEGKLLKKLSLSLCLGENIELAPFAKALEHSKSLQVLKLHLCQANMVTLFHALAGNATLRHLDLDSSTMCGTHATALANALRRNKGLRSLAMEHCSVNDEIARKLAEAITENGTLETLNLKENAISALSITAFCTALKKNKTLKRVSFGMFHASDADRNDLAQLLNQSDCYGRIAMPWADSDLPHLTAALAVPSQSPSKLSLYEIADLPKELVCLLFDALASNTAVKALTVEVRGYEADKANSLYQALKANQSIRSLELQLSVESLEGSIITGVAKALVINKTISELAIYTSDVSLNASKTLAFMLAKNTTLTSLQLCCRYLGAKRIEMLSRGMTQNKAVISLDLYKALAKNRATFRLQEALRQNIAYLNMAVQFVLMTNLTKPCAEAFETLRRTSSLVPQVIKVSGMSEQQAKKALDAADHYIRTHYLFVTGIIKHSLMCYPGERKQADALNDYCWEAIAAFLKVSDVLDERPSLGGNAAALSNT